MGGTFRPYKRMVKRQGKDPRGIISQRGRRGKGLDGWTVLVRQTEKARGIELYVRLPIYLR